jgi:hypothetical protein
MRRRRKKCQEKNQVNRSFGFSYRGSTRSTGMPSRIATSSIVSDSDENILNRLAKPQTVTG